MYRNVIRTIKSIPILGPGLRVEDFNVRTCSTCKHCKAVGKFVAHTKLDRPSHPLPAYALWQRRLRGHTQGRSTKHQAENIYNVHRHHDFLQRASKAAMGSEGITHLPLISSCNNRATVLAEAGSTYSLSKGEGNSTPK